MKKIVLLALLLVPTMSFAASSVRVLGTKNATTTSGATATAAPAAKVLPAKAATASSASAGSRVGTVRALPKVASGTVSTAATNSTSRFPVITPAHSYNTVNKPQTVSGGTTVINADLDNYYNKDEVNTIINELKDDEDPRVDMIHLGNKRADWFRTHEDRVKDLEREGYVFMWVEEE